MGHWGTTLYPHKWWYKHEFQLFIPFTPGPSLAVWPRTPRLHQHQVPVHRDPRRVDLKIVRHVGSPVDKESSSESVGKWRKILGWKWDLELIYDSKVGEPNSIFHFGLWYISYYGIHGVYKPTCNQGAPHCSMGVSINGGSPMDNWLVVWNIFYFPIYWESHHPNWRTHMFQRGGEEPPTR